MPPNNHFTLEICVETAAGLAACKGYADRIELCSGLDLGGLTPSWGQMQAAKASGVETHVLIRPRTGDFFMTSDDLAVAIADIEAVRSIGLHGVVIGAASGGALDVGPLGKMMDEARGLNVTLHRAFDVVDDMAVALEQAIDLGFDRILTSGGATSAPLGAAQLALLGKQAAGRIEVMAGAGIKASNITALAEETGLRAFHASATSAQPVGQTFADLGFGGHVRGVDAAEVRKLRAALDQLSVGV